MAAALGPGLAACGGSDGASPTTSSAAATTPSTGGATTATPAGTGSTTSAAGVTTTTTTTAAAGLAGASITRHTAPAQGEGVALLRDVRLGRHQGFERIVFEFAGSAVPGYRVEWVDGPITADASGEVVPVTGDAYLEIVMQPASGVDMTSPDATVTYDGPDRIPVAGRTELITDLVRTGDFEAVLSWAAGAGRRVPFRVSTLSGPTRVVIDLDTSA
jgi:hypothetical protein